MFTSINVTADQPLSKNSTARGGGGFWAYRHKIFESFRALSLNSEDMLRGTDNFYFILISFSFK